VTQTAGPVLIVNRLVNAQTFNTREYIDRKTVANKQYLKYIFFGGLPMIYVGIDISKYKHDCYICNDFGDVLNEGFTFSQ